MDSSKNFIQLIKNKTKKYLPKKVKGFIKDQLKVLQTQGPVPAHTLWIRSSISESDRKIFETVFFSSVSSFLSLII